jgi:lipopolysaccharide transport system permease protein
VAGDQNAVGATVKAAVAPENVLTVVRPPGRWPGLGLAELWQYRAICLVLARRSLMVRYRQTLIGAAWSLLQPILLMIVFTVFFGLLGRLPSEGLPFPVFFFIGLMIWQKVAKIVNEGSTSIVSNRGLVGRVYFPRAYFPISVALASLVDLAISFVALAILLVIFGIFPGPILYVPLLVALSWFTALGVTFFLAALDVSYRDIAQLLPFLVQVWFFSSPIIYASQIVPAPYRWIYFLNPIAVSIEGLRVTIAHANAPATAEGWLGGTIVALFVLVGGYLFFRYREPTFADYA